MDGYYKTTMAKKLRRGDYSDGFHTYGMQWTPNYIYFYIDSRIHQILFIGFKPEVPLFDLGEFSRQSQNSTVVPNPWLKSNATDGNAPFDQKFYLVLNVAVGSRNGWFLYVKKSLVGHVTPHPFFICIHCIHALTLLCQCRDNVGGKPWIDDAKNAQWNFWNAANKWLPTWGQGDERGMTVRSVKMWQAGHCEK